tara:strand:+ start:2058 stop:2945 length:888 start_codon:yes stop_codon:yes gene_type:complete
MFKVIRSNWLNQFKGILSNNAIDQKLWDELEELLIISDIGLHSTQIILDNFKTVLKSNKSNASLEDVIDLLKTELIDLLDDNGGKEGVHSNRKPVVLMMVGVNGVGKTTSIAKLANFYKTKGNSVMLGAADTFRAAAQEQLTTWAERIEVPIVTGQMNADPASVAYDSVSSTVKRKIDVSIIDTAGRMHTSSNLMNELIKIKRVISKVIPEDSIFPILTLDATLGQNAFLQAKEFSKSLGCKGVFLSKLDGTAKGGIVFPIVMDLQLPILWIGTGEKLDDCDVFESKKFVDAMFA